MRYPEVLPPGWAAELYDRVDFDDAFEKLRGVKHFFAWTMRGFIRTQQLRPKAAWPHFRRAFELASKVDETIPNLVRQFLTSVLCIENALLEGSVKPGTELPPPWFPEMPEEILDEYPEVRTVLTQRKATEATLRLHTGDNEGAVELYEELVGEIDPTGKPESFAAYSIGLAAAHHNLGNEDEALKSIHAAGLAVTVGGTTIQCLRNASILAMFHEFLGQANEAANWRAYVKALPCPEVSKELYHRREAKMLKRSLRTASLLFF